MKKHYLTIAVLALALGMTACSSKSSDSTSAAETVAGSTTGASTDALVEEEYFDGFVGTVEDSIITVADDAGKEVKFDISGAAVEGADAVGTGDQVEVSYTGQLSDDVTKATAVDVITSAAEESESEAAEEEDPIISGTIEKADDNELSIKTDDGTYTLNAKIAQKVTVGGIKAGVAADVTYYGDLDEEAVDPEDMPVATKIVTEDAADSEDAKVNTLSGKVAQSGTDYVVLDTVDPANTMFSFEGKAGMFDSVKVGDEVTVIYEGTLTDKTIVALGLKK